MIAGPQHIETQGLSDVVLSDHRGTPVRLGDLWIDQPVILVLLRHYG